MDLVLSFLDILRHYIHLDCAEDTDKDKKLRGAELTRDMEERL